MRSRHRAALLVLALGAAALPAWAQTGALRVEVADPAGSPVAGATVTIAHSTGYVATTSQLADRDGVVVFPVLRATGSGGPGYTITVAMPGFATLRVPDVKVRLTETTLLPIRLSETLEERVKVVERGEVVDLEDTTQTTRFSDDFIQDLPVAGRFYQNVLTLAPGVQDANGDGNPNVHGSRDRDFKAVVSGISNVDPLTGQQMSQVNPNSIEEMEVITAGAGVEFSRAQGGFARILQKQGSNEHEGVFELYWRSSKLDGDGAADDDNVNEPDFDWIQPAFQLSGPIIKDRMWYRLSHEWIDREIPQDTTRGIVVVGDRQGIHADQITWQASPRNKLAFQYQADPRHRENFGVSSARPEEAALDIDNESEIYSLTWTAPYSPKILVESQVAWQDLNVAVGGTTRGVPNRCLEGPGFLERAQCFNIETGTISGSYPQDIDDHRQRLTVRGEATVYGGNFLGASHQFRLGLTTENERYTRELRRGPTVSFFLLDSSDRTNAGGNTPEKRALIFGTFSVPEFTEVTARGTNWGAYAEDRLKPAQNVTLTLGLRVDREEIRSDGRSPFDPEAESATFLSRLDGGIPINEATQSTFTAYEAQRDFFTQLAHVLGVPFNVLFGSQSNTALESSFWRTTRTAENVATSNTNVAPRVALAWDPFSDGKTKIAATVGRYYDKTFLNVPLIELEPASTELVFDATQSADAWTVTGLRESIDPAVNVKVMDRDLRTPYQDEWTLAVERELWQETSGKITYIQRRYRDQLQDIDLNHVPADFGRCSRQLTPAQPTILPVVPADGDYDPRLAPGDGIQDDCVGELEEFFGSRELFLQRPDGRADLYVQNPGWGDIYLVGNLNRIDYESFVLELTRRQFRSWELQSSYTWSTAKGDGEDFNQSLGNDRSLIQDEQGYQAYDQRHVVKVNATTITPWGFRFGGAVTWQSGLPYSVLLRKPGFDAVPPLYQTLGANGNVRQRTYYPSGVRNDQRNDSYWNVDLKLTREFRVGRSVNVQATAEVFNVLNDGTYQIFDPVPETGEQINGNNVALRRFGRQWQLGLRLGF